MQLNLNEVLKALESLKKINQEKFSIKTTYKLSKLASTLEKEAILYEEAVRKALIKYSKKDENDNPISESVEQGEKFDILPENQKKCMAEIEELGNSLVDLPDYYFSFEDFGDLEMSVNELFGLIPFIKDTKEE